MLKILLFASLLIVADLAIGFGLDRLRDRAHGNNDPSRNHHIASVATDSVVIFGSSRGYHHYDSSLMADTLGLSVVNAGEDGNGIILAYGRYLLMAERYTPKVALIDIEPGFDIAPGDNTRYLKPLRPFYEDAPALRQLFADIEGSEPVKMYSHLYRYNSQLPAMAKSLMARDSLIDYDLLQGQDNDFEQKVARDKPFEADYDPLKRRYLIKFIEECRKRGTLPVLAFSPHYGKSDSSELDQVKAIARQYNVPVLDHYADTAFVTKPQLFVDPFHLNSDGARAYSALIARELRDLFN